jgi:hypothetical protein
MPATATPSETESAQVQVQISAEMWKTYRLARLSGAKPHVARSVTLEDSPYQSARGREAAVAALEAREAADGLDLTPEERAEEVRVEAAAAEAEAEATRFAATRQLPALEEDWNRLQARVSIGDVDAIEATKEIESEMRSAKQELDRQASEVAQAAEAEREGQQSAAASAEKMRPHISELKAIADAKAIEWMQSVVNLRDEQEQLRAFVAVAQPGDQMAMHAAEFRPAEVESSIRYHARGVLFSRVSGRDAPLVPEQEGE